MGLYVKIIVNNIISAEDIYEIKNNGMELEF